jgi:transposase
MGKMEGKRRKFTAEFKLKVVLEALKEKQSLAELSEKHNVAGSQISSWKTEVIKNAALLFGSPKVIVSDEDAEKERLFSKIGQLQLENDYLKKNLR